MIALTPPLGWNTWNTYGLDIHEELILESARAMVDNGLRDAGYTYVVIDDGWALPQRDENGRLVADPKKFPLHSGAGGRSACHGPEAGHLFLRGPYDLRRLSRQQFL